MKIINVVFAVSGMALIAFATAGAVPTIQTASAQQGQPAIETAFVAAVSEAREHYRAAANDMAKGGARVARKAAICHSLTQLAVTNWVGKIYTLSSNSDGNGVVEIVIGPDVYVKTWNNALSDIGDHTLIPAQSPLFQVLSAMKTGDTVKFSGTFLRGDADCIKEPSLTQDGSMTEPEFLMRFSSASPAQ
jgi:hypothetical protein